MRNPHPERHPQVLAANWRRFVILAALHKHEGDLVSLHTLASELGIEAQLLRLDLTKHVASGRVIRRPIAKPSMANRKHGQFMYRAAALPNLGDHPKARRPNRFGGMSCLN